MNINFADQDESFIRSKVSKGYYSNATELVRDAVRKMREDDEKKERLDALRALVMTGHEQAVRGEVIEYTDDLAEQVMQKAMENHKAGKPIADEVKP